MEFVDGVSLDRLVGRKGPLPIATACLFARQTAIGLQHAHDKGMVHRDVKPHNLVVTRKGHVKIWTSGWHASIGPTKARPLRPQWPR